MSTDLDLARRAAACRGWRWLPGMLVWGGDRITEDTLGIAHGVVPDFRDPATRGALLQLVREAWGDDRADVSFAFERWACHVCGQFFWADTEPAALIAALEAAQERKL